jgi:hypothetical protein
MGCVLDCLNDLLGGMVTVTDLKKHFGSLGRVVEGRPRLLGTPAARIFRFLAHRPMVAGGFNCRRIPDKIYFLVSHNDRSVVVVEIFA